MGSGQSSPSDAELQEQIARKIRALELRAQSWEQQAQAEEDYVHVNKEKSENPPQMSAEVKVATIEQWEKQLMQDPKNRLALSALSSAAAATILTQRSTLVKDSQTFNVKIPLEGAPITNQRSSGRCWLFASTNVFRVALMRHHNLEEFELSQAYLFFWDKLEKANFFLEQILDTTDEDLDGRLVQTLLSSPVGDGGQWDMVSNLVEKYGLVPHDLYPDAFAAMNSGSINSVITTKLREDALALRRLSQSKSPSAQADIAAAKAKMMQEIHLILTLTLGPPPAPDSTFSWEYYSSDKKFHTMKKTPKQFASELSSSSAIRACAGTDVNTLFSLVNDPRNSYGQLLTVNRLGNIVGGKGIRYINVDMPTIKAACISMLKKGHPIFFGSDVGKYSSSASGIMDLALVDYSLAFNISLSMSKSQRLQTGESAMTHAMVLTAVHLDGADKPVRWRVQNSWGDQAGDKGWFVMSDEWMDQFVYQAVVDPACVAKEVRDVLGTKPKVLELWDPMGALA